MDFFNRRKALVYCYFVVLVVWVVMIQEIHSLNCGPDPGLPVHDCKKLIKKCKNLYGIKMKWTSIGTVIGGQVQGDGGCQCDQYCGFLTKEPCNRDGQCTWKNGACYNEKFDILGTPILNCPLTLAPTKSPTTSTPSKTPTTSTPTRNPTTSSPSLSPVQISCAWTGGTDVCEGQSACGNLGCTICSLDADNINAYCVPDQTCPQTSCASDSDCKPNERCLQSCCPFPSCFAVGANVCPEYELSPPEG
jgi:hypothetical protein